MQDRGRQISLSSRTACFACFMELVPGYTVPYFEKPYIYVCIRNTYIYVYDIYCIYMKNIY